jgi:hypothetical protein
VCPDLPVLRHQRQIYDTWLYRYEEEGLDDNHGRKKSRGQLRFLPGHQLVVDDPSLEADVQGTP